MKNFRFIILIFAFVSAFQLSANAQDAQRIFSDLQSAFNKGDASLVTVHLGDETYISLLNGYSDYYSRSQAYYVLTEFISFFSPMKMKLTHIVANSSSPYAWGKLFYSARGKNKTAKVFVSVSKTNGKFVISQLTIN